MSSDSVKYDANMRFPDSKLTNLKWLNPKEEPFSINGFAWFDKENIYRRMPGKPKYTLPKAVDSLADNTAGGQIRFRSNTKQLAIRAQLQGINQMTHMAVTGQNGFDCYWGEIGSMFYISTTRFSTTSPVFEFLFYDVEEMETRDITINFPLYQGVKEVSVGVDNTAEVLPPKPYNSVKRIIIYGTSITQGGCAARPGMAYTNVLSRKLNYEFVNLGFSGSGRGEPEVAKTIAELENPLCFILDYEANCGGTGQLSKTLPEFIKILRECHRDVPIIVISAIQHSGENFNKKVKSSRKKNFEIEKKTVETYKSSGDKNIFFIDGSEFLGKDFDECTVDGTHPTDLGYYKMANSLLPQFKSILNIK